MGPTGLAKVALGIQPVGINRAVMRPQAMNAPTLGMTIPAKKPPSSWIFSLMAHISIEDVNKDLGSSLDRILVILPIASLHLVARKCLLLPSLRVSTHGCSFSRAMPENYLAPVGRDSSKLLLLNFDGSPVKGPLC